MTHTSDQNDDRTTDALEILSIVTGGDGLARRPDGCVVFVPRTVPGERVSVVYTQQSRQWARARVVDVIDAAPQRCEPSCRHYARCGGCQLQHMDYDSQLDAKSGVIVESLRRLGGIDIDPPEVVRSAREFEYRNRLTFVLRQDGDTVLAGFHSIDAPSDIVDIDGCPLAEGPINRAWSALRAAWVDNSRHMPRGDELRLTLRVNVAGEVGLAIEGARDPGDPGLLFESVADLVALWMLDGDGHMVYRAGKRTLDEKWGTLSVPIAGTAFVQVNRDVAAQMDDYLLEQAGEINGSHVIDTYCGFGLRALEMSRRGATVLGIELDRHSVNAAKKMAVESGSTARFIATGVERSLARELPADLVILNPPRSGVMKPVVTALVEQPPARVIYVSCDPATLARDLKGLATAFDVEACRAFDLFPQTAHVETVVTLARKK